MEMNEKILMRAFERIKKITKEKFGKDSLSLAWLITQKNKCALLIVCQKKGDDEEDCLLFDIHGNLLYQHHYNDSNSDSYYNVIDFFETKFWTVDCENNIITIDKQKYNTLIIDTQNSVEYVYKYCRDRKWMEKALFDSPLREIKYICSIFKLNQLYGIHSEDLPMTFYLRFATINKDNKIVLYHDIEYKGFENYDFLYIDEYILDGLT
ncbi:MAG: hypothetical protein NC200_08560 [Candidatus Gastranaerophilales bacterium]|nr:hypothetical protein [Candidatus Gastranaerophilales bacterium]